MGGGYRVRFEARELKKYTEAVQLNELKEGGIYFLVEFLDRAMHVPKLEPVVYVGKDLSPGDVGQVYFQDAASYLEGGRFGAEVDPAESEPVFIQTPSSGMRPVFEYERALEVLMSCSLRRQGIT